MAPNITRRRLLQLSATAPLGLIYTLFPLRFFATPVEKLLDKPLPHEAFRHLIDPKNDIYEIEKFAVEIEQAFHEFLKNGRPLPIHPGLKAPSPVPAVYKNLSPNLRQAVFGPPADLQRAFQAWRNSLGQIHRAAFFYLGQKLLRYEIASTGDTGNLQYRTGLWKIDWKDNAIVDFAPFEEFLAHAPEPLFQNITAHCLANCASSGQLLHGIPYWRSRLDPATGIDIYGSNGIAVADIDSDGRDEIYVCQPGGLPNRLYKVDENLHLLDITEQANLAVLDDTASALFCDLRNTGHQDLVVLTSHGPLLFLNRGDGTFQFKPGAFQFKSPPRGTFTGIAAADFDCDGRVDLYLCTYLYFRSEDQYRYPVPYHKAENGPPNFLFRNQLNPDGSGYFEDVTAETGLNVNNNRYTFAAGWCDFNNDGWPDLYVVNDFGANNLYLNERGKFLEVADQAGVLDIGPGMSVAWNDFNNDGYFDLLVSNMWAPSGLRLLDDPNFKPVTRYKLRQLYYRHARGNSLYLNTGHDTFEDASDHLRIRIGRWAWASDMVDFDNDGTPEIFVTCGMTTNEHGPDLMSFFWRQVVANTPPEARPQPDYEKAWNALNEFIREGYHWNGNEPNLFYKFTGNTFVDVSGISGLDLALDSRAFAVTDLDNDGALDLLLKSRLAPQLAVFQNRSAGSNHSLAIRLVGTKSNRDAIGARLTLQLPDGTSLHRELQATSGFLSQHTKWIYFGLGQHTRAHSLTIRWPSGDIHVFEDLQAGFRYEITEGKTNIRKFPFTATPLRPAQKLLTPTNTPSVEPVWFLDPVPSPLPAPEKLPALLVVYAGEPPELPSQLPVTLLNLETLPPQQRAILTLLRRYLLDYRQPLKPPQAFLLNNENAICCFFPALPSAQTLTDALEALQRHPDLAGRAIPYRGTYYSTPARNFFQLGAAFFYAGYPAEAILYLNKVLERNPDNFKTHLAVGQIYLEQQNLDEAEKHIRTALRLNPNSPDVWNNLGGIAMARHQLEPALSHFEQALKLNPDLPYVLLNAGQLARRLKQFNKAEQYLRKAVELEPNNLEALNQLGLTLAQSGHLDEAKEIFKRALTIDPRYPAVINNLAIVYARQNQLNDAIAALQYGIRVAPDHEDFYFNLAMIYRATGQLERARDVLLKLLQRQPDNQQAQQALEKLNTP